MRSPALPTRPLAVATIVAALSVVLVAGQASADPKTPRFGPVIEDYAEHESPERCRPGAKPGVAAFGELLEDAYPDTRWIGIGRACTGEATSDHHEGRALDWSRDAHDRSERNDARELLHWLFAADDHGNKDAMARRLGITYVIWNREIWGSWSGDWSVYCVQKPSGCRDPDSRALMNPHTDHIHISFGWDGAQMRTTFWDPEASRAD
jgi:hypothetical protein